MWRLNRAANYSGLDGEAFFYGGFSPSWTMKGFMVNKQIEVVTFCFAVNLLCVNYGHGFVIMSSMSNFQKVSRSGIKLGEPLPYSVYDEHGVLLLRAGFAINLQRQLDRLLDVGLYYNKADSTNPPPQRKIDSQRDDEEANTFLMLDTTKIRLHRIFDQYRAGRGIEDFLDRIEDIAITIQECCSHDIDAALANLHLDYDTSYAIVHCMQAAILCEITGKHLGVKEDVRLVLVKAALTHDIGLIDIQDTLDRQVEPLTDVQKDRIRQHPTDSVGRLLTLGVSNETWLDAVAHHHERLDGSGYPDQLSGSAIKTPTRVMAVADIYSAMIRDRPYRKAMVSREAMRQLLVEQASKTDQRLIQMMIKNVGVFPPGAIVELENKEIAVVKQRQASSLNPIVYSFIKPTGMPMLVPVKRDTSAPGYKINGILPFSKYKGSISVIRGLWLKESAT